MKKENFLAFPEALVDSKFVENLTRLLCSGINDYLESIFSANDVRSRRNSEPRNKSIETVNRKEPKALSLRDRVQTIFYTDFILISICFSYFLLENIFSKLLNNFRFTCKVRAFKCYFN